MVLNSRSYAKHYLGFYTTVLITLRKAALIFCVTFTSKCKLSVILDKNPSKWIDILTKCVCMIIRKKNMQFRNKLLLFLFISVCSYVNKTKQKDKQVNKYLH